MRASLCANLSSVSSSHAGSKGLPSGGQLGKPPIIMQGSTSAARKGWSPRFRYWSVGILGGLLLGFALGAHDVLSEFVQHDVRLQLGPAHIDLTVDLTFFEEASDVERRRMDQDGDGRIRRVELEVYARDLDRRLREGVKLKLGEQAPALTPLHSPELDLLGDDRVHRSHHRLRLSYFCSTPPGLEPGAVIVVEQGLWPEWPAVITVGGAGTAGYQLRAEKLTSALTKKLGAGEVRKFRWIITRVPTPAAGASTTPTSDIKQVEP
jgi:hypothetical protein